jgi:predicted nucleotidyltransferase
MMAAKAAEHVRSIADSHNYEVEKLMVYGSVARGDHTADSDVDLIIVSPDFADTDFYAQAAEFLFDWDTQEHTIPDLIPLTPAEFRERTSRDSDVVSVAVREGIHF